MIQKNTSQRRPRVFTRQRYHGIKYNVERFFGWTENYRKIMVRYEPSQTHF